MNPSESFSNTQSSDCNPHDVESLLQQMKLRGPSDRLDHLIAGVDATSEMNERPVSVGVRFGWNAIFATAAAAMLAGVWLGLAFLPSVDLFSGPNVAADESKTSGSKVLTPVAFNVEAFNLLHGHSQQEGFENCDQCHLSAAEGDGLGEIFQGWFYGDAHLFEVHPKGLDDCSKCHVAAAEEEEKPAEDWHRGIAKLANCSECHKVDADGFDGFKNSWLSTANSSEG